MRRALIALLLLSPLPGLAEEPPTETKGLSGSMLNQMPLAPEFAETGARILRTRLLEVEPGGTVALHSHAERPSIEYVLDGSATEIRPGGEAKEVKAGDVIPADHTVEHGWRVGAEGITLLAVDIYVPE